MARQQVTLQCVSSMNRIYTDNNTKKIDMVLLSNPQTSLRCCQLMLFMEKLNQFQAMCICWVYYTPVPNTFSLVFL